MVPYPKVIIVGGGPAGVFAAITCAEVSRSASVTVLEKSSQFLGKVRISGGGRCNVTHASFDPRKLSEFYPRGSQSLIGPFHMFQPNDAKAWFEKRGVTLKTEQDGRMFPITDASQTVVDCLLRSARDAGVNLIHGQTVEQASPLLDGGFTLKLANGDSIDCDRLMLATGGCRAAAAGQLSVSLGHKLVPPVPSLFAFQLDAPWLTKLAGISMETVEVSVPGLKLRQKGALMITHGGISGPAVLRTSAWAARDLHAMGYRFTARINWMPGRSEEQLLSALQTLRDRHPARRMVNTPLFSLPARLWESLILQAGSAVETRWAELSSAKRHSILQQLIACDLPVVGKSLNKEEFVTAGGIPLQEVNFKTMESRIRPGLYFGGELLDIDGVTGGFNFQAAWTTGWIAGNAIGRE